ncbi:MAG: UPF0182 family protein [Prochlorococcus sp.]
MRGFSRNHRDLIRLGPWLLLAAGLAWILLRMQVEWAWFSQFDWQQVLLRRWLLQGAGLIVALFIVLPCQRWQRRWQTLQRSPGNGALPYGLIGWGYSAALLGSAALVLSDVALLMRLAWLAVLRPFTLGHWWAESISNNSALLVSFSTLIFALLLLIGPRRGLKVLQLIGSACFSITVARAWGLWALAIALPPMGRIEPLLGADVTFGMGRFPAVALILVLLCLLLLLNLSTALLRSFCQPKVLTDWAHPAFSTAQKRHLQPLIALILLGTAGLLWLSRHQLLWTESGPVAGAGWLDAHFVLPLRATAAIATALLALMIWPLPQVQKRWPLRLLASMVALVSLLLEILLTPLLQWFVVKPRELHLESAYLSHAIKATRHSFQLDAISSSTFKPRQRLTKADLAKATSTIPNIRLWDSQPLLATNRQLQQLRVYYQFTNAAVDRYRLEPGRKVRQQVIIAARELDQAKLPKGSKTWLNRHFVFTHGYGFTLSPVNTRSADGLPDYFISNLGEATKIRGSKVLGITKQNVKAAVPIGRAALYFGMLNSPYAVAPSRVEEFDYPEGDDNRYNHYKGSGGVPLENSLQRLAASVYLSDPRLLNTGALKKNSKLLLRREVRQRVKVIAPFLDMLADPYLVSLPLGKGADGYERNQHQYWVVDGFTSTRTYPYASSLPDGRPLRYLRNSVKAIVDAYNGSVHLYISEPDDPLIKGWQRVFPELFKPLESMPQILRDHMMVSSPMFDIQVQQLLRYHVTNPRVFYSGDDVWEVPKELYGRRQVPIHPYHITAQLRPNEPSEFLLLQPLTPLSRPNLAAWLAARNDGSRYGEMVLLRFPSQESIFGPEQIQALINQNPVISQKFGLWDRAGSEVVQGNLLVVPIGDALLYVEPVYLRASMGGLPTLTRVVVTDGYRMAMAESLRKAIMALMDENNNGMIVLDTQKPFNAELKGMLELPK